MFSYTFDAAYTIRNKLTRIFGRKIPIVMLMDSASHFNVIGKTSGTTEKRLMIELAATREAYDRCEIDEIGWVDTASNIVDEFIKARSNIQLEKLLDIRELIKLYYNGLKVTQGITR